MSIKISAVIITYNEEINIDRCLRSLVGVVDEIVVLDSFSSDKTEEICRPYGVQFFQHAFDGHIEQKNRAMTHASHDYVLSLDADEALDELAVKDVLSKKSNWDADGFYINRTTNFCGKWIKHCGWYPDKKLRLFKKGKGSWQGINPHDKYEQIKGATEKRIAGNILHYSFPTIDSFYTQQTKFSLISAEAYLKRGKKANYFLLIFKPFGRFLRDYFFKLGFLDGKSGLIICLTAAYSKFMIYSKLLDIQKAK